MSIEKRTSGLGSPRTRPEVLQDPNVPKPLHGFNLRHLLGEDWWDEVRHEAYRKAGYRCVACGIPKSQTREKYLVAHQRYHYDYVTGRAELLEVVALCADCKSFIHSGLQIILAEKGEKTREEVIRIFEHGKNVLQKAGLRPWWGTVYLWMQFIGHSESRTVALMTQRGLMPRKEPSCDWSDWHIVVPGEGYVQHTPYENFDEWYWSYNPDGSQVLRRKALPQKKCTRSGLDDIFREIWDKHHGEDGPYPGDDWNSDDISPYDFID